MNKPIQPVFKKGTIIQVGTEQVEILRIYPPGHQYASYNRYFYLIRSTDCGEDVWNEHILVEMAAEYEAKKLNKLSQDPKWELINP